ncbi:MAG: diaminopimelate decarboxylase [Thermoplasmatota archaeon]
MRDFDEVDNQMMIGGLSTVDLAEEYGTPLFVTDEGAVRENYRRIRDAFSSRYPTTIHYASKANTNMALLRILEQEGSHIDAVSLGEVDTCLQAGFSPDRILYTGVSVSDHELEALVGRGVTINIDSLSQMRRLAGIDTEVPVSFRINPAVGAGHHEKVVTGAKGSKFGIPKDQVMGAYEEALELGFEPLGIHAHIGSGGLEVAPFREVTQVLASFACQMEEELDLSLRFLDIGGGVGIPYRPEESPLDLEAVADAVASEMEDCPVPELAIEPGRYIVGDTTLLLARVNDVKETSEKRYIGVDAGFNILLRPSFYGAYHHVAVANRFGERGELMYDVVGPICETGDYLAKDRLLPRVEEGDLVAVYDAGAYGYVMSSQYNSRPRCREVLVNEGRASLIRERESMEDLLRDQRIPSRLML